MALIRIEYDLNVRHERAIRVPSAEIRAAVNHLPGVAEYNEMAAPSYTHTIPLIPWLFWRRLDTALRLAQLTESDSVLDFGCGTGVLLPSLAARCAKVYATDLFTSPSRALVAARRLNNVVFLEEPAAIDRAIPFSVECAFALDVLEHVPNLERTLESLHACLSSAGRLVISGPTETVFYRAGRAVAGFRNEYHHRNARDILRTALNAGWRLQEYGHEPGLLLPRAFEIYRLVKGGS